LTLEEKMVIVRKYIIPELNRKMGFFGSVILTDELIEYMIETYTNESGVRKLKEVLFDLFGEINIELLKNTNDSSSNDGSPCTNIAVPEITQMPITITIEMLETKYLSKYDKIREKRIHISPEVGVINGLWASSNGRGGIIPIQTMFFPANSFLDLRLTGLQGDVMKESMNVAKTLAWNLLDSREKRTWLKEVDETKTQGLHIHCPEGAVSKDGPSAGAAITLAIYSLLSNRPIKNNVVAEPTIQSSSSQ
jgi:ATP-dependent Lon protease